MSKFNFDRGLFDFLYNQELQQNTNRSPQEISQQILEQFRNDPSYRHEAEANYIDFLKNECKSRVYDFSRSACPSESQCGKVRFWTRQSERKRIAECETKAHNCPISTENYFYNKASPKYDRLKERFRSRDIQDFQLKNRLIKELAEAEAECQSFTPASQSSRYFYY